MRCLIYWMLQFQIKEAGDCWSTLVALSNWLLFLVFPIVKERPFPWQRSQKNFILSGLQSIRAIKVTLVVREGVGGQLALLVLHQFHFSKLHQNHFEAKKDCEVSRFIFFNQCYTVIRSTLYEVGCKDSSESRRKSHIIKEW